MGGMLSLVKGNAVVKVKTVCVYCGASTRVDELYRETAARLGYVIARAGMQVVYGGGRIGLMGCRRFSFKKWCLCYWCYPQNS